MNRRCATAFVSSVVPLFSSMFSRNLCWKRGDSKKSRSLSTYDSEGMEILADSRVEFELAMLALEGSNILRCPSSV